MKSRHIRNNSLFQQKSRYQQFTHHRSYSYTRHKKHSAFLHMHHLTPQNINTQSITIPQSAQLHSKSRHKYLQKESSKFLKKQKKKLRSKDKQGLLQSKGKSQRYTQTKRSGQKSRKRFSKQLVRHKYSHEKEYSTQNRHLKSGQLKSKSHKHDKSNQKTKKGKIKHEEEPFAEWQTILQDYGNYLTPSEIVQIKEYKWIYFLGKIKQRKQNGCRPISILEQVNTAQSQEDQFYKYQIGDHIAYRYQIIESINQGSFGQVLKVFDHKSQQFLALKIAKKNQELVQQTFMQISILTQIRQKDKSNLSGIVRIKDFTIFRNHICMLFELLDGNLYELLVANNYQGLRQDIVRIFAVQILNSLAFLHKQGIIHCDIKPQNIVMKNWGKSGVKLIDFGTSCFQGKQVYQYLQSRYYRAPEVIFKQKYSHPIDMWSFGCLMAQLKLGQPIFAGSTNRQQLIYIANSIGLPQKDDGPYSKFFLESQQFQQIIKQNYIDEYQSIVKNEISIKDHDFFSHCKYAKTCMKTLKQRLLQTENQNNSEFYDFLKKILVWQPNRRLSPQQALQDSWITKGLPTEIKQLYTIFNSTEYTKRTKKSSKDSKTSVNKRTSQKSKQKRKSKQGITGKKQENSTHGWKSKIQYKFDGNSGKPYQGNFKGH